MFWSTAPALHVQAHLDCVAGMIGEGDGERENLEKKARDQGKEEGTPAVKTPFD